MFAWLATLLFSLSHNESMCPCDNYEYSYTAVLLRVIKQYSDMISYLTLWKDSLRQRTSCNY